MGDLVASIERWANDLYLVAGDKPHVRNRIRAMLQAQPNSMINPLHLIQPSPNPTAVGLTRLDQSALIITGDSDIGDVYAHAGAIEFGLCQAQRIVASSAGHFVNLEYPTLLNELIRDFITTHSAVE